MHVEVNNRNTRTRCEIYSKLIIKTPELRKWRVSSVTFEQGNAGMEVRLQACPPLYCKRTRMRVFSEIFPTFFKIVSFTTPVKNCFSKNENRGILFYWVNVVSYYEISTNLYLEKHWFNISIFLTGWFI